MNSATAERIPARSAVRVNTRMHKDMARRMEYYQRHPEEISRRLAELDEEWDIDRTVNANLSILALSSLLQSLIIGRKPVFVAAGCIAFQLQHAIQGWSPPARIFRSLGFRTAAEIEDERKALSDLRGGSGTVELDSGETIASS